MNNTVSNFDNRGIATGNATEDRKSRKKFIVDFYAKWNMATPTKQVYNKSLSCFIEVRFLSINETSRIASYRYSSTVAVTFLTEILENAKKIRTEKPKLNNKNQERFSKMFIMEYSKENGGRIKLTVGELRGSRQKIQYCISVIENG
jgi:hypothetical protein